MEVYNDTFHEQIVKRETSAKDSALSGLVIFVAIFAVLTLIAIPQLGIFGVVAAMGLGYLAYRFVRGRSGLEFEYSVTNGVFDVAKIIAKSSRKDMLSVSLDKISRMGLADERNRLALEKAKFDKRIDVTSHSKDSENAVYFIVAKVKEKNTLIFFEPNEDILNSCKRYVPRAIFY